tara:strand:+ start:73 stop:1839 length:1767 start_codon:yes stop_codon:yes gene_type:complete
MKNKKTQINIVNLNKEKNLRLLKNSKNKTFLMGPWCKNDTDLLNEDFKDTLNFYSEEKINKYKKDILFLKKIYSILLNIIIKNLNTIHKKKFSKRSWEILISRWLFTWISSVYFRWEYVKKINEKYIINKLINLKINPNHVIPLDTLGAHRMYRGRDQWSSLTFNQIFNYKYKKKVKFNYLRESKYRNKKNYLIMSFPKFLFQNESKIFLYKSELNLKAKFKIRKYINFYSLNFFSNKKIYEKKDNMRNNFNELLPEFKKKDFLNFLISTVKYNLPKIFLENFNDLEKIYLKSKWPKNAKYIITSYGLYYDELFKFYVSDEISKNKNIKLCILQHGYANIFESDDFYNVWLERKISDIFLSWGKAKRKKNTPFFYPRVSGPNINNYKFNKNKNILILTYSFSNTLHSPPDGSLNGDIVNQKNLFMLFSFLNNTKNEINNKIYIKNQNSNTFKNFTNSLRKNFPLIKFENEKKMLLKVINNFNVFIHIFFGTPFFECMALNKPSIIIYNEYDHWPLDKNFKSYLKKFKKNNILFENEKLAAQFLNKNYFFLEKWWNNKKIQKIRKDFCKDYCIYADKDVEIFKKIFLKN